MQHEEWRPIEGHPNYEVSNMGNVRSMERLTLIGNGAKRIDNARVMRQQKLGRTGYLQVTLTGHRKFAVHRLVALAFCDGHSPELIVNHKNGVRNDNRAENLEWVTYSENSAHGFRVNGRKNPFTGRTGSDHPTSKRVRATCIATGAVTVYESAADAERLGFNGSSISHCCSGRYKSHKGHKWELVDPAPRGIEDIRGAA